MNRSFLCVVEGRGSQWEAMCLDLDISVAGDSFDDVKHRLQDAIALYVEAAFEEAPADRERLLNRRAPLWLRLKTLVELFATLLMAPKSGKTEAGFRLPCPA